MWVIERRALPVNIESKALVRSGSPSTDPLFVGDVLSLLAFICGNVNLVTFGVDSGVDSNPRRCFNFPDLPQSLHTDASEFQDFAVKPERGHTASHIMHSLVTSTAAERGMYGGHSRSSSCLCIEPLPKVAVQCASLVRRPA